MGKKIDLTGQKFGHLTVLGESSRRNRNGCVIWICQCDCENQTIVETQSNNLRNGSATSCGCVQKQQARKLHYQNLVGQKFGYLTVLKETKERDQGSIVWECRCDCGNLTTASTFNLHQGNKISCGCIRSIGEKKIQEILQKHNIPYKKEYTFKDCIFPETNKMAKFDFYVNNQYIIEYDGEQHFKSKSKGWNTEEHLSKTQEHDKIKNEYCFKNNIPIIRIPYTHLNKIAYGDLILETSSFILKNEGEK